MSEVSYIRLEDVAFARGGSGFPEIYQGGKIGIPFIKVSDMNLPGNERFIYKSNNFLEPNLIKRLNATVFEKKSIVFAKVGAALLLNRRRILSEPTAIDNNMMAVEATSINFNFLYHFLTTVDFGKFSQPGAVPSINQQHIHNLKVPKFDSKEQKKIAEILTFADEKIELIEKIINKKKSIKNGLFHDLLNKLNSRKLELGKFCKIEIGGTPSRANDSYWSATNEGFPWVSISDMKSGLISSTKESITESGIKASNVKLVRKNSLIMSFKLTLGKVAITGVDLYTNEAIAAVYPDEICKTMWLYYLLPYVIQNSVSENAVKGSTLNKQSMAKLLVPLTDTKSQDIFIDVMSTCDREIGDLSFILDKLKIQKQGLMQDLFSGQVRVNV
jgi:restriction endonuclease S subunit